MTHEHHQWLEDVNKDIIAAYKREQTEIAGKRERVQELGHRVEAKWIEVLSEWLPPEYEVSDRKYILLEEGDREMTGETDIVVFYPHYPKKLRKKKTVLASGVAAAFSVKRTISRGEIRSAYEEGIALRRGMALRDRELRYHLIPPTFFGLLGESHDWKAPGSEPKNNVKTITDEFEKALVEAPREGLDLLCVADLGTWRRNTTVISEGFIARQKWPTELLLALSGSTKPETIVLSGLLHNYEQTTLSPLTNFIGSLWGLLAINDPTLRPLADGLRITKTLDTTGGLNVGSGAYKLAEVSSPEIASRYSTQPIWSY